MPPPHRRCLIFFLVLKIRKILIAKFTSKGSICGTRLHVRTPNFSKIFKGRGNPLPLHPSPGQRSHNILHGNPLEKSWPCHCKHYVIAPFYVIDPELPGSPIQVSASRRYPFRMQMKQRKILVIVKECFCGLHARILA